MDQNKIPVKNRDKEWTFIAAFIAVVLYFFARFFGESILNLEMTDTSAIFLSLIPFVAYLVAFNKISEFGGGGITLKFTKASEARVNYKEEAVAYIHAQDIDKGDMAALFGEVLPNMVRNPSSTLTIVKKNIEGYYQFSVLKTYLEELTRFDAFKYVVFLGEGDKFKGFLYARSVLHWFSQGNEYRGKVLIDKINSWSVDKIEGFRDHYVYDDRSNKEALKQIDDQNLSEVAVVDKNMKFLGFTDRQIITSRIVNSMTNPD